MLKKIIFSFFVSFFLLSLGTREGISQPKPEEGKGPDIRLGEVTFGIREIESTPSSIKLLEIHFEVFNRSQRIVAPPDSIKAVVVPKEIKYPEGVSVPEFKPVQEEATLAVPLPPNTGRVLIFGFSLPEKRPESIIFEIQINPPDGEKKTVKWEGG